MGVYAEYNPLISYRDNNEILIATISAGLGRAITDKEFASFVEKFNDVVTNFAGQLIDELIDDEEMWLDIDEVTE